MLLLGYKNHFLRTHPNKRQCTSPNMHHNNCNNNYPSHSTQLRYQVLLYIYCHNTLFFFAHSALYFPTSPTQQVINSNGNDTVTTTITTTTTTTSSKRWGQKRRQTPTQTQTQNKRTHTAGQQSCFYYYCG